MGFRLQKKDTLYYFLNIKHNDSACLYVNYHICTNFREGGPSSVGGIVMGSLEILDSKLLV